MDEWQVRRRAMEIIVRELPDDWIDAYRVLAQLLALIEENAIGLVEEAQAQQKGLH